MKQISLRKWGRVAKNITNDCLAFQYERGSSVCLVALFVSGPKPDDFVYARTAAYGAWGNYKFAQRMTQREWMDYMRKWRME